MICCCTPAQCEGGDATLHTEHLQAAKDELPVIGFCEALIGIHQSYTFSQKWADVDQWPIDRNTSFVIIFFRFMTVQ